MKLYRNTTYAVIQALESIFTENKYADKVIEKVLKQNSKWGARDRRFIAETTYDIVRWYRLLCSIMEAEEDDYWRLIAGWCILNEAELPDWEEFKGINRKSVLKKYAQVKSVRSVRESIPDWLDDLGQFELGADWDRELTALNNEAEVVLRVNTLKTSRLHLQEALADQGILSTTHAAYPDALILDRRQNVFKLPEFKTGDFEVQDAGSQMISAFLRVEPGQRIVDACAGAGGKTLHLAALAQNKGKIIALDVEQWKLDELKKRARRAGVDNVEARLIDSSRVIKRLDKMADRLLLDVPCSGLGVLKRNPDAKWKLSLEFIQRVKELQQHILNDYCTILKPNGLMVYSTCSIMPSENNEQVQKLLDNHTNEFELIEEKSIMPSEGFDGFYMALIKRLK